MDGDEVLSLTCDEEFCSAVVRLTKAPVAVLGVGSLTTARLEPDQKGCATPP